MAYYYGYHTLSRGRRRRNGKGSWGGGGVGFGDLLITVLVFSAIMIVLIYMQSLLKEDTGPNANDVYYVLSASEDEIQLTMLNSEKTTTINTAKFEESENGGFFVMYNADTKKYSTVLISDVVECLKKRE